MKTIAISKCKNGHIYLEVSFTGYTTAVCRDGAFYGVRELQGRKCLHREEHVSRKGTCTPLQDLGLYAVGHGWLNSPAHEKHAIMALEVKARRYKDEHAALSV